MAVAVRIVGGLPLVAGWCVLCQCESGSGASLGAHALVGSDRHAGSLLGPAVPADLSGLADRRVRYLRSEALW
jgi:hypothetical protein